MDIFKLVGSVYIDTKKAEGSLSKVDDKAKNTAKSFSASATTALLWGKTIYDETAKIAAAMADVVMKTILSVDAVDKNSQAVGLSTEEYQKWKYAMGQSGVSAEEFASMAEKLREKVLSVTEGNKDAIAAFARLGVEVYDSSGKLRSQDDIMNDVIMTLADMEDTTLRDKLAVELFGKSGYDLIPMLNSGKDSIEDLKDEADKLGLVLKDDDISAVVQLGDELDKFNNKVETSREKIVSKFAPALVTLAEKINAVIAAWESLSNFQGNAIQKLSAAIGIVKGNSSTEEDTGTKSSFWQKFLKGSSVASKAMMPYMADGGVLEKGQVGFLEGNGAEAVVPLENNKGWTRAVAEEMNAALGGAETITLLTSILDAIQNVDASASIKIVPDDRKLFEVVREQSYQNSKRGGKPITV